MEQADSLLLARRYTERPEHVHDGKLIVMRSNLRWCSDGFEFTRWNGDILRGACSPPRNHRLACRRLIFPS